MQHCRTYNHIIKLTTVNLGTYALYVLLNTNCIPHINGLAQDCGSYIADALDLPQSCTKPFILFGLSHIWQPPRHVDTSVEEVILNQFTMDLALN